MRAPVPISAYFGPRCSADPNVGPVGRFRWPESRTETAATEWNESFQGCCFTFRHLLKVLASEEKGNYRAVPMTVGCNGRKWSACSRTGGDYGLSRADEKE